MSMNATASIVQPLSLQQRLQTGIAYNTIGAVFNQGSTFAVNIIVANLLGRQVFGEYAMVQGTLATMALISQLAAGYTATKYVAEFRSTDPRRAGGILGMLMVFSAGVAGIVGLTLLVISGWLAGSVLKAPGLGTALAIGSGVLVFAVLNGLLMGALAGLESYRRLARALVWSGLAYLVVCTGLAWRGGLNGAVAGLAFSGLFQFVLLAVALRKECSLQGITIHYAGIARERSILLKFALPGALSGFTSMPALWLASALLVRQPNGYSQMALYSAAYALMTVVLFLPGITNNVGMSLINHHKGAGKEPEFRRAFWMNLAASTTTVIVGACVVAVFGPELLRLFGRNFSDGYSVLAIMMAAAVPEGLTVALNQVMQSQGKMWLAVFAINLPRDTTILLVALWLVPFHGALGLATGYLSGRLLALIVMSVLVVRIGLALPPEEDAKLPAAAASPACNPAHPATTAPVIGCPLCRSTECSTDRSSGK